MQRKIFGTQLSYSLDYFAFHSNEMKNFEKSETEGLKKK